MADPASELEAALLDLGGGDPFDDVRLASDEHRMGHPGCRLFPAGGRVMSLAAQVVRSARPRRILDLGCGLGYSTLWLASAAPAGASIVGIDADAEHVALAARLARKHRLGARVSFMAGPVAPVVAGLNEPVDVVHDDAWFAETPSHYDRVVELLAPGGILTMPNWFLLSDALGDASRQDWAQLAGPRWRETTREFAALIARDERLQPVWVTQPPLLIAVRSPG